MKRKRISQANQSEGPHVWLSSIGSGPGCNVFTAWSSATNELVARVVRINDSFRCEWYVGTRPANLYDFGDGNWTIGIGFVAGRTVRTRDEAISYLNGD